MAGFRTPIDPRQKGKLSSAQNTLALLGLAMLKGNVGNRPEEMENAGTNVL